MRKTKLITIAINIIFVIALLVYIPTLFSNKDYILLGFLSVSCIISVYNCFIFLKRDNNKDDYMRDIDQKKLKIICTVLAILIFISSLFISFIFQNVSTDFTWIMFFFAIVVAIIPNIIKKQKSSYLGLLICVIFIFYYFSQITIK